MRVARPTRRERACWESWGARLPRPQRGRYDYVDRGWTIAPNDLVEWLLGRTDWATPYKLRACIAVCRQNSTLHWWMPLKAREFAESVREGAPHIDRSTLALWLDIGPWYAVPRAEEQIGLGKASRALERMPGARMKVDACDTWVPGSPLRNYLHGWEEGPGMHLAYEALRACGYSDSEAHQLVRLGQKNHGTQRALARCSPEHWESARAFLALAQMPDIGGQP